MLAPAFFSPEHILDVYQIKRGGFSGHQDKFSLLFQADVCSPRKKLSDIPFATAARVFMLQGGR